MYICTSLNFLCLPAVLSYRPFHTARHFFKCHLSLAFAISLQDLDLCLAYKTSSGHLVSFVLNIFNEKKQELKELNGTDRTE